MEEVLKKFGSLGDQDVGNKKTDFEDMYKNWGRLGHQEQRRKDLLEIQKSNRMDKLDKVRGILEIVDAVEEENVWREKKIRYRPQIYVAGFNKASESYKDVLMMSEWLIEKPQDFQENWYIVPCPKGVRMIVVSNRGVTKCYTKYGQFKFETSTALPGGNQIDSKNQCCVLDCFYQSQNNTMYVLDLLAWNNQTMTDGETEFRHFWLTSKFSELPHLKIISKKNKLFFTILPKVSCETRTLNEFLCKYPAFECNFPPLDGFLFYHKKGNYVGQETPLVGWLFPYMVNEVLGEEYTVHENYFVDKPVGYTNQRDFIQKFEDNLAKKKPKWLRKQNMDTDISSDDNPQNDSETTGSMDTETTGNKINGVSDDVSNSDVTSEEAMDAEVTKEKFKEQNPPSSDKKSNGAEEKTN